MAFDPSIIMGYRGMGELPNPMNQLAQVSQIQAAQQQGQMNQMKIEEMLAERKEIDATAAALKDKGYTPQTYFEMMVSSRNPERQKVGAEGLFRLKRQADFQSQFGPALGKMFGEPTAAPAETPAAGTFAADTAARRTAMAPAAPVNAMAPASVNAMAPATAAARQPASINQMEQMAMQLGQYEDVPGAKTVANLLEKKLEAARKITSGAPGHVLYQNGVAISTVPETTPTNLKEFDAFQKMTPVERKAFLELKRSGQAGGITMVSERAEQGARGKMLVDDFSTISKAAQLANKTIPSIEANLNILNKGFDTGFGTETIAAGANVLAALGVKDANKYATDAQMIKSKATEAVLQKQLEQKGPQTESDAQRIDVVGAQLGKTKDANQFVLTVAKEQFKRDVDQRNFYSNWYKNNKTYDGAEDAWYAGRGGESLFASPALKKYTAPTNVNAATAASNRPSLDSIFKK